MKEITGNELDSFIVDDDKTIIDEWCKHNNVALSIRETGEASVACLKKGAGAKPHSILDKTIKSKAAGDAGDRYMKTLSDSGDTKKSYVRGLVGHWTAAGEIDGLYLTDVGKRVLKKINGLTILEENGKSYVHITEKDEFEKMRTKALKNQLNELNEPGINPSEKEDRLSDYLFYRLFYSGDYDIHDILQDKQVVPSKLDTELLEDIQSKLVTGRRERLEQELKAYVSDGKKLNDLLGAENSADYQRIQHGAQFNYIAQMLDENRLLKEKDKEKRLRRLNIIVDKVAGMSVNIALCHVELDSNAHKTIKWQLLENENEIIKFYEKNGLAVKSTWSDEEERKKFVDKTFELAVKLAGQILQEKKSQNAICVENIVEQLKTDVQVYKNEKGDKGSEFYQNVEKAWKKIKG